MWLHDVRCFVACCRRERHTYFAYTCRREIVGPWRRNWCRCKSLRRVSDFNGWKLSRITVRTRTTPPAPRVPVVIRQSGREKRRGAISIRQNWLLSLRGTRNGVERCTTRRIGFLFRKKSRKVRKMRRLTSDIGDGSKFSLLKLRHIRI